MRKELRKKSVSESMLGSLERREANRYDGPSCAISFDPNYVRSMNEFLDKIDPNSEQAFRNARKMLKTK